MGFFSFLRGPDIHAGLAQFEAVPGAVLLDVRTPEEYAQGHIPGSRNLPLDALDGVGQVVPEQETPLFVYCLSGARSRSAVSALQRMGYSAENIGGISSYRGEIERG